MINYLEDINILTIVLEAIDGLEVNPLVPIESEAYFNNLIDELKSINSKDIKDKIRERVVIDFKFIESRPKWIQGKNWPFHKGKPMVFLNQIDLAAKNSFNLFHDDTSIYVFISQDKDGVIETIIQQY